MSGAAGHVDPSNKKIALLISVLALVLALSETLGNASQTAGLAYNIEASNLWNFFQAKSIRMTAVRTAADSLAAESADTAPEKVQKQIAKWRETAERYDSEPSTGEGRKELAARAKDAEAKRDRAMAAYHQYEVASGAVQIAIVLASATIITGATALAWIAGGLGIVGIVFSAIGLFAPTAVHLF